MRKWMIVCCCLVPLATHWGCSGDDDDPGDTGNPWDDGTDSDTEDTETNETGYLCLDPAEIDEEECGAYPEHENEMWDINAVVPNSTFKAFYDRDCDGVPEETVLDMYKDVYCQRDKIKSLVLTVGSNCGSNGGED